MTTLLSSSARRKLALLMALLVATDLAVLLDIPIFRQVLGFVFLTFVPGLLIVYLLKLDKLGLAERFVLSVGLSLFFSMFFGLLINWSYFSLGYATPLSTKSLVISFSFILVTLCIVAYKTNREAFSFRISELRLNTAEKAVLLLPSIFPFLSIYGMRVMNITSNNTLLMVLLFLIPVYVILVAVLNQKIPERIYPAVVFLMGISIILMVSLRSNHIIGLDAHSEYNLFRMTATNQHWQIFMRSNLDSCLSISLLPSIYQSIMNINPERLFNIFFSLIFSTSSLVVYIISQKYIGSSYAFFASFFFISLPDFAITPLLARSNMAILFFGLAIMVIFHNDISDSTKKLLFIIFMSCVVVSHYSTTYILFYVLLTTWMGMQIFTRIIFYRRDVSVEKGNPFAPISKKVASSVESNTVISETAGFEHPFKCFINISVVVLFFVVLFLWYSQVTEVAFGSGIRFVEDSIASLHELFILESRSSTVMSAFGQSENFRSLFVAKVIFVAYWMNIALIATGVLTTLLRFRETLSTFPGHETAGYLSEKIDAEFFLLSLAFCFMLVVSLVVPFISTGYSMSRQYIMAMVLLSLFLVLGAMTIAKYVRLKPRWLLTTVLVLYFLCTSGALYQVTGTPSAFTLNSEGNSYDLYYINDEEGNSAKWLGEKMEPEKRIYTDYSGSNRLLTQGSIPYGSSSHIVSFLKENRELDGYIYLRRYNVVNGKFLIRQTISQEIGEDWQRLSAEDKIYANGGSELWR